MSKFRGPAQKCALLERADPSCTRKTYFSGPQESLNFLKTLGTRATVFRDTAEARELLECQISGDPTQNTAFWERGDPNFTRKTNFFGSYQRLNFLKGLGTRATIFRDGAEAQGPIP